MVNKKMLVLLVALSLIIFFIIFINIINSSKDVESVSYWNTITIDDIIYELEIILLEENDSVEIGDMI
ncbi:MAG: hypothetical protein R6V50_00765 [Thermoplasmatota archaeon]